MWLIDNRYDDVENAVIVIDNWSWYFEYIRMWNAPIEKLICMNWSGIFFSIQMFGVNKDGVTGFC